MIGSDLLRYQDNQRFVIFDFETTGLNGFHSLPWQLAYAECTIKTMGPVTVRYPFYKDLRVSDEAARVTRFDMDHYQSVAEDPVKVLADFERLALDPSVLLVGHNILGFDALILQTMRRMQGKRADWCYVPRMIDTLCLSRAYRHMIQPERGAAFTSWQYKMLSFHEKLKKPKVTDESAPLTPQQAHALAQKGTGCSLGAMAREFDIPYDERQAHDAAYDINVNFNVFQRLLWCIEV